MKTDYYEQMTEEDNEFLNQWIDERLAQWEEDGKNSEFYQEAFDFYKATEDNYTEI